MKKLSIILFVVTITALGCTPRGTDPVLPPIGKDEISAERLWSRLTAETDYSKYSYWPDHEGLTPGQSPHGAFHKVYINRLLYEALPVTEGEVPDGSIIVKENYSAGEELMNLTVMAKVEGFNAEANDWFWAAYSPKGDVAVAGQVQSCIDCHAGMKDNDYIIVHLLAESAP